LPAPTFDLQSHSLHSDGQLPAPEVVTRAAAAGVELFALTDHDTIDGVDEALGAARASGIRLSPAVELSAVHGDYEDLHILGYGIDHHSPGFLQALTECRSDRTRRIDRMVQRLLELGFAVSDRSLQARRETGKPIGRPHLAAAVLSHPDNAMRLSREGIRDANALFPAYLVPGAPAYVPRSTPTVPEAIEMIHAAGGVAVWAHPFWDMADPQEVVDTIDRFRGEGLDGVEVFYVTHTRVQTNLLADHCDEHGLLTTGSTDFHGPEHGRFSRFAGFSLAGREPNLGPIAERAL